MPRDGRGTPGRFLPKGSVPRLKLTDLVRRRRTTLGAFVSQLGITTYASLEIWCKRTGVNPPSREEFVTAFPAAEKVNSPQEGVVVLEAPPVIAEATGRKLPDRVVDVLSPVSGSVFTDMPDDAQKKSRKKKEGQPTEE